MAIAPQRWIFVVARFCMVPFTSLTQSIYNAEIVQHAEKTEIGEITGLLGSLQSLTMFAGPLIGTFALNEHFSVFFVAFALVIVSLFVILEYIKVIKRVERNQNVIT